MSWHRATTLEALRARPMQVFKHQRHQLAIVYADGRCHAIDNRCPHEGYPLSQGTVDDACVLTCNWHNWKFDLASGRNLGNGDHVRCYPVELRDGEVWVDLSELPPAQQRAAALAGLREAFDDRDHGFMARQLARLSAAGFDPADEALPLAISWCAPRLEWGMTHAIPATAEWLAFHDQRRDDLEARITIVCEALEHLAHDGLREPERPFPPAREQGPAGFDEAAFLAEVEAADEAAIARVRGALQAGLGFADLEPSLARAALAHYAGFGHALIYVGLVGRLIDRLGPTVADPALSALVRNFLHATREDLIPEFRGLADAVARFPADALEYVGEPRSVGEQAIARLLAANLREAFDWVLEQVDSHGLRPTWEGLMHAGALSLLRFDLRCESAVAVTVDDNVGWLDFTHALTFASAVRQQASRDGALWGPGLLQLACFCARNRRYRLALDAGVGDLGDGLGNDWQIDAGSLFAAIDSRLLDHDLPLPIFPAHILKTRWAVARMLEHVRPEVGAAMLAALNRFVHAPIRQRHARRDVFQALALIGGE